MTGEQRAQLLEAAHALEREAYMHGLRNGVPHGSFKAGHFVPDREDRPSVGGPHHEARERLVALITGGSPMQTCSNCQGLIFRDEDALSYTSPQPMPITWLLCRKCYDRFAAKPEHENSRYVVTCVFEVDAFDADTAARLISRETGAPLASGYRQFGSDDHLSKARIVSTRTAWIEEGKTHE